MPPELGAFLLGYLLVMVSPGPNMVAIGTEEPRLLVRT
jgi:threonine/homoserine/homoserine lactone efflux protein